MSQKHLNSSSFSENFTSLNPLSQEQNLNEKPNEKTSQ